MTSDQAIDAAISLLESNGVAFSRMTISTRHVIGELLPASYADPIGVWFVQFHLPENDDVVVSPNSIDVLVAESTGAASIFDSL